MLKTDRELADELDARDRLEARGYKRKLCDKCGGTGQSYPDIVCNKCEGKGCRWEAPITK